jgi:hypothetical protein
MWILSYGTKMFGYCVRALLHHLEIPDKAQKSLITPIMSRLHRLKGIETKEKSVE